MIEGVLGRGRKSLIVSLTVPFLSTLGTSVAERKKTGQPNPNFPWNIVRVPHSLDAYDRCAQYNAFAPTACSVVSKRLSTVHYTAWTEAPPLTPDSASFRGYRPLIHPMNRHWDVVSTERGTHNEPSVGQLKQESWKFGGVAISVPRLFELRNTLYGEMGIRILRFWIG